MAYIFNRDRTELLGSCINASVLPTPRRDGPTVYGSILNKAKLKGTFAPEFS
jgi:hypothetical protein